MIDLCYEYLFGRCIWLYVIIMSRTRFKVNLPSTLLSSEKDKNTVISKTLEIGRFNIYEMYKEYVQN